MTIPESAGAKKKYMKLKPGSFDAFSVFTKQMALRHLGGLDC